jgi:hypothetical protein
MSRPFPASRKMKQCQVFFISNFSRVLNVICFLLGDSPAGGGGLGGCGVGVGGWGGGGGGWGLGGGGGGGGGVDGWMD